MEGPGHFPA